MVNCTEAMSLCGGDRACTARAEDMKLSSHTSTDMIAGIPGGDRGQAARQHNNACQTSQQQVLPRSGAARCTSGSSWAGACWRRLRCGSSPRASPATAPSSPSPVTCTAAIASSATACCPWSPSPSSPCSCRGARLCCLVWSVVRNIPCSQLRRDISGAHSARHDVAASCAAIACIRMFPCQDILRRVYQSPKAAECDVQQHFDVRYPCVCRGLLANTAGGLVVVWCTALAAQLLVRRAPVLQPNRALVAYPCFLTYSAFALLTLY